MSKKPLTPSEELEKLEQQITLAYLEIDHNFSRAHHVVTKRILPIIDRYAAESKSLWNGSEVGCGSMRCRYSETHGNTVLEEVF